MKRRKIFNRLMEFRAQAVRGNAELDQYFDLIVSDIGRVLGLSDEDCATLRGPGRRRSEAPERLFDNVATKEPVRKIEIGQKMDDGEAVFRFLHIYGDPDNGYMASSEEHFIPEAGGPMRFFNILFETTAHSTVDNAIVDAMQDAIMEAITDGFTITV